MATDDNTTEHGDKEVSKEQRILRMCKKVLTDVAKDTVTPPGLKHPLTEHTIQSIRECLQLIAAREAEIQALLGHSATSKPYFTDQPQKTVVVNLKTSKKKPDPNQDG